LEQSTPAGTSNIDVIAELVASSQIGTASKEGGSIFIMSKTVQFVYFMVHCSADHIMCAGLGMQYYLLV
jgi:hypothetical protein